MLLAALIGGSLYPPTNYDALCYRLPRILHWWSEGHWHWIGGWNGRMDYSATGFEWLTAPLIILFKTDRLIFLINLISYAFLPGLIYSAFTGLGISRRVAWNWMWILPSAYCFAIQAGSIGNDSFAAVYFLASIAFALRSRERMSFIDAAIALLAAALLTGAKASNLPLLLPLAFLIIPIYKILLGRPLALCGVLILSMLTSFLPLAIETSIHLGDWSGDPQNKEKMKLDNPITGVIGNSLQIGIGAMSPPLFPFAKIWNNKTTELFGHGSLNYLQKQFPRLNLGMGELPDEESAGLGMGISLLLLLSLGAALVIGGGEVTARKALYFGLLCWIALAAYMAKLGSESAARLVAAYYPGLILPVLSLSGQRIVIRRGWWKIAAVCAQLMVLPSLLLNPARPLLPVATLTDWLQQKHLLRSLTERINKVYSVYSERNDSLSEVRINLPHGVKHIGFAGTSDESEYSFWRGLSDVKVIDLNLVSRNHPWGSGLDCIVGSEWGFHDRYHQSVLEFAKSIGGTIYWDGAIATFASRNPDRWYVITKQ
jgi:hypothetical protein